MHKTLCLHGELWDFHEHDALANEELHTVALHCERVSDGPSSHCTSRWLNGSPKAACTMGGVFKEAHRAYTLRAVDDLCWQHKCARRDIPVQGANGTKSEEGVHA
jgi:hypothetical protein